LLTTNHPNLADRLLGCEAGLRELLADWNGADREDGRFDNRPAWDNWNKRR
jgi:hypothetical protein